MKNIILNNCLLTLKHKHIISILTYVDSGSADTTLQVMEKFTLNNDFNKVMIFEK